MSVRNKDKTKRKVTVTPKQLANLRPAKKGERSRNPLGGKLHNPMIRAFKNLHKETFREVLESVLTGDESALQEMIHPSQPSLLRLVAKAMINAIQSGDYGLVERISERLLGKVPDKILLSSNNITAVTSIDPVALKAAREKLERDV